MSKNKIACNYFSQEDLLKAGCLDLDMAMNAVEDALKSFESDEVLFPEKIVQIFNQETQERINCLPATFRTKEICGVKWVSVFPPNPVKHGLQNLSAVILLSEIKTGFPIAFMEGTLCSNMRVGAVGGVAAKYLAKKNPESIGFIGSGEQAKMHMIAMKTRFPSITECRIGAKTSEEESVFIHQLKPIYNDVHFIAAETDLEKATKDADIIVTATSAQAPLLKASWVGPGSFYSHVGGWEDEYEVAQKSDKIVCDDWETVKHRTQTLSRMYKDGVLEDKSIYANLPDLVMGRKTGRESEEEKIYFNAVGLAYLDIAIAIAMYEKAKNEKAGQQLVLQEDMIFNHQNIAQYVRN